MSIHRAGFGVNGMGVGRRQDFCNPCSFATAATTEAKDRCEVSGFLVAAPSVRVTRKVCFVLSLAPMHQVFFVLSLAPMPQAFFVVSVAPMPQAFYVSGLAP